MYGGDIPTSELQPQYYLVSRNNADAILCTAGNIERAIFVLHVKTAKVQVCSRERAKQILNDPDSTVRVLR